MPRINGVDAKASSIPAAKGESLSVLQLIDQLENIADQLLAR
jgi:hypothetical protein